MTDQDMYIETDKIHTCANGAKYPIVIYEGNECYKLSNGTLKSCDTGKMITGKFVENKITKENSKDMRALRHKKAQDAIREGLIRGYEKKNKISLPLDARKSAVYGAIADMTDNMYQIASTGDKLQSVKAFEVLLKTGDFVPGTGKNSGSTTNIAINNLTMQQITQIQDDLGALQDVEEDE